MQLNNIFSSVSNLIGVGYRSNAFAPFVWFLGVISVFLITVFLVSSNIVFESIAFGSIILLGIYGVCTYNNLLKRTPKLLQSEKYRIEDRKLDIIATKENGVELIEDQTLTLPPNEKGGADE